MDDVRAVIDAAGSERAVLFGAHEAAAMCTLFAATYPERTLGLDARTTRYAKGTWAPDYPWAATPLRSHRERSRKRAEHLGDARDTPIEMVGSRSLLQTPTTRSSSPPGPAIEQALGEPESRRDRACG